MRYKAWIITAALLAACQSGVPDLVDSDPDPGPSPGGPRAVLLVGESGSLNESDRAIRNRLGALGFAVQVIDDDAFRARDTVAARVILSSKTAAPSKVNALLKSCPCGVIFWHDNLQARNRLATVTNDGSDGAVWHRLEDFVWVLPAAPAALRDGLSGEVLFYTALAEISYGRSPDVPPTATVVAELGDPGGHKVIYLYKRGDALGDGSPAAGKRLFFGIHRNTFVLLTPEGLKLFDASVRWASQD